MSRRFGGREARRFAGAVAATVVLAAGSAGPAAAQRAQENAVRMASDAFGTNIGNEQVGLYSPNDARGFSPTSAGNVRLDGFYLDAPGGLSPRVVAGSQVRVGLTAQSYPFPSPTGVVDFRLRPAGDRRVGSLVVSAGQFGGHNVEYDAQQPLAGGRASLAYGLQYQRYEPLPGDARVAYTFGLAPRWSPSDRLDVRAFYAWLKRDDEKGAILTFPGGPALPPAIEPRNFAPSWIGSHFVAQQAGAMATAEIDPRWTLRLGGFWYDNDNAGTISDAYLGVDASGVAAVRRFTHLKPFEHESLSGEARLSGVFARDGLQHTVNATLRVRDVKRTYGGAATAAFANLAVGQDNAPAEPNWTYGPHFNDAIRQYALGGAYQLAFGRMGEVGVGLQRTDYRRELTAPAGGRSEVRTSPWLANASASANLGPRVALYGAFTRGLEEAPVAPEVATNAAEPPAAIRTRQHEFGARFLVRPNLRLVVGWFDIEKPYFNLDAGRTWRELGMETHSGVETSLAGELARGLTMVAGYVHQEPRVSGEAVRSGLIADNPVGQPRDTARVSFDYRPWETAGLSVEAGVNYYGERPVSARGYAELGGRQLTTPAYATVDLGVRHRFAAAGKRSMLRVQVQNVADRNGWSVNTAGGLTPITPRRFVASLTTDF